MSGEDDDTNGNNKAAATGTGTGTGMKAGDTREQEDVWSLVCQASFFKDEPRFAKDEVPTNAPTPRDADAVVLTVERLREGVEVPEKSVSVDAAALLQKLGCVVMDGAWTHEADALAGLWKSKDTHRRAFHERIAKLRYDAFAQEIVRILNGPALRTHGAMSAESETFAETADLASEQRTAVADFVTRYGNNPSTAPVVAGLHAALALQKGKSEVTGWQLEDATLVERGHELAYAALELLLVHLRCTLLHDPRSETSSSSVGALEAGAASPKSSPPSELSSGGAERVFVMDTSLSDKRIDHLLRLFPAATVTTGKKRVAQSGTPCESVEPARKRINREGEADAPCPQDSMFYAVISKCEIL
ncbi:Hypothetical Protein FCC1311_016852 [Hondaea fermentalgiana]|uniref:Uncharacterized protein n=1 Tax=Hondaea fermentalgiana TaxID=2315210 RepID=A0A2R5G353_9STRA|nr:Hypothetical Protein FCC1311_016852 [Hondaea fermentalgiana]|eukprot:GBG25466.1 Hypothetical Protein FCC1311_016852 [Hondaea fermentalgiana]